MGLRPVFAASLIRLQLPPGLQYASVGGGTGRRSLGQRLLRLGTTLDATRAFAYDPYGQLVSAETEASGQIQLSLSYAFDAIGNRLEALRSRPLDPDPLLSTSYAANSVNQYITISGANADVPSYDANGNATTLNGQLLSYDEENRLVKVVSGLQMVAYVYDGLGRRVERREYEGAAVTGWTRFVYDGWRVAEELDGQHATVRSYTLGSDLSGGMEGAGGIGGLLALTRFDSGSAQSASYLYDGNGNVAGMAGSDGALLARYRYDPFGQELEASGAWAQTNPIRFSSKSLEPVTGFYYYGYRFYDPRTGRWINRDPLEEAGGLNLYGFIGNDPVNALDPLGLSEIRNVAGAVFVGGQTSLISIAGFVGRAVVGVGRVAAMALETSALGYALALDAAGLRDTAVYGHLRDFSDSMGAADAAMSAFQDAMSEEEAALRERVESFWADALGLDRCSVGYNFTSFLTELFFPPAVGAASKAGSLQRLAAKGEALLAKVPAMLSKLKRPIERLRNGVSGTGNSGGRALTSTGNAANRIAQSGKYIAPTDAGKLKAIHSEVRRLYDLHKPRFRTIGSDQARISKVNPNDTLLGLAHPQDASISLFKGRNLATLYEELRHIDQIVSGRYKGLSPAQIPAAVRRGWEDQVKQELLELGFELAK